MLWSMFGLLYSMLWYGIRMVWIIYSIYMVWFIYGIYMVYKCNKYGIRRYGICMV